MATIKNSFYLPSDVRPSDDEAAPVADKGTRVPVSDGVTAAGRDPSAVVTRQNKVNKPHIRCM